MPTKKARTKDDLLIPDKETAKILGITLTKLYNACDYFDSDPDDEWELNEGEHFEWLNKGVRKRRFYETGAMAIAKYLQEKARSNIVIGFLDVVREKLTNRRKKVRQQLVKRRIINEFTGLGDVNVKGELVFLSRKKAIKILATNGKGFNYAIRREQENPDLSGREPMESGTHFDQIDHEIQWSQRGIARIAQNMSENLQNKSRRAWTDAVFEIIQEAVKEQRLYLESFDSRVAKVMREAKIAARNTCKVTKQRRTAVNDFDLHAHHLFDRSTRPDIADEPNNLLVMHEDIHDGFHNFHKESSCEPCDFVEYITTVEIDRFETASQKQHLTSLINRLEKIQKTYE